MHGGHEGLMQAPHSEEHVVVTPCRDHVEIFQLIDSVVTQTILPEKWTIVLHNISNVDFKRISDRIAGINWISLVRVNDGSERKRGSQIARLVNIGISDIKLKWKYLSKIDADMVLESDYFENILRRFSENEKLGIASGNCYLHEGDKIHIERVPKTHTRGGLKTYRKMCYDDIGGIREVDGWDGVDNLAAQMSGWETINFRNILALHTRRTGSYSGLLNGCFETGNFAYAMRYSLVFMLARSLHRMSETHFF